MEDNLLASQADLQKREEHVRDLALELRDAQAQVRSEQVHTTGLESKVHRYAPYDILSR